MQIGMADQPQARARRPEGLCTTCGGALDAAAEVFVSGGGCCGACLTWYRTDHVGKSPEYRHPLQIDALERLAALLRGRPGL